MRGTFSAFVEMRTKRFISRFSIRICDFRWIQVSVGPLLAAQEKRRTQPCRVAANSFVSNGFFFGARWCKKRKRRLPFCILQRCIAGWFGYANRANKEIHRAKLFECCVTLFSVDLTPSIFRSSLNILRCVFSFAYSSLLSFSRLCVLFATPLHLQQHQKIQCVRKKF